MKGCRHYLILLLVLVSGLIVNNCYAQGEQLKNNPNAIRKISTDQKIGNNTYFISQEKSGGLLDDDKTIYGYIVDGGNTNGFGVVSFAANKPGQTKLEYQYSQLISAGAYARGHFYSFSFWESAAGFLFTDSFDKIDLKTGEKTQITSFIHSEDTPVISDMTYDYSTNTMYGFKTKVTIDVQTSILIYTTTLYKIDLTTGLLTEVGEMQDLALITLACTYNGQLYGIATGGAFYKINKKDCTKQLIGTTGYKPWYQQSMDFDHTNGNLYWAAQTEDRSFFAKVDITNGQVTELGDFANLASISGIYAPFSIVKQGAPNYITEISATTGPDLNTTLSWKNPDTDPFGAPLTQLTGVRVYRNNVLIRNYPTNKIGGTASWKDATVPSDGQYTYSLMAYNSVGNGEIDSIKTYVGKDIPGKPVNLMLRNENAIGKLTWEDSPNGANGGWYDKTTLRYKITRYPDNITLDENFNGTSYTDNNISELKKYWYTVEAHNETGGGQTSKSNTLVYGPAVPLPYFYDFENEEPFSLWSIVNNNNDHKTWERFQLTYETNWQGCYLHTDKPGFNADDYMLTPPVFLEAGKKYRIYYDYRSSSDIWTENFKVTIGKEPTHNSQKDNILTEKIGVGNKSYITDKLFYTPTETANYYMGFYCFSNYYAYRLYIDNVKIEEVSGIDMRALTVSGRKYPVANTQNTYIVKVDNNGNVNISNFKVQLIDNEGNLLTTKDVEMELAPSQTAEIEIIWIPQELKALTIKGKVILTDDGDDTNDITQSGIIATVQPEFGNKLVDIGTRGETDYHTPFNFYYNGSIVQTIYDHEEMRDQPSSITTIKYYNSFTQKITGRVQIFMANTEKENLSEGWIPQSEFELVFDGNITFPSGNNEIQIELQKPFVYNGSNLCIMATYPFKQQNYGFRETFYQTSTPLKPNRCRYNMALWESQYTLDDPGKLTNAIPDIMFVLNQDGAAIKGNVKSNGTNLEGVQIEIPELSIKSMTDEAGNYELPFVLVGNQTIKASKLGYYTVSRPIEIVNEVNMTENFELKTIPQYKVSGKITDLDNNPISNANIQIKGYQDYTTTTNTNGEFIIDKVYAIDNYQFTVEHKMFESYEETLTLIDKDLVLPVIKLTDKPLMSMRVYANVSDNSEAIITWEKPKESILLRIDNGTKEREGGFDNVLPYCAIGVVYKKSAIIDNISWYQGIHENISKQYNVYIFELDSEGNPTTNLMYSSTDITAKANSWNTHKLEKLFAAPNGCMIAIGSSSGFTGVGLDSGTDPDYPFAYNTCYSTSNYKEYGFSKMESGFYRNNFMIRATGYEYENDDLLSRCILKENKKTCIENITICKTQIEETQSPFVNLNLSASKQIQGYLVWRLTEENENDESKWLSLTSEKITEQTITDASFSTLPQGVYKYAVKTVYSGNKTSQSSMSNILAKQMSTNVTINVNVNEETIKPEGAIVKLANKDNNLSHVYSGQINENGSLILNNIWKGIYNIEISLDGCDLYTENNIDLSTENNYVKQYTLKEIIVKPFNLEIKDSEDKTAKIFSWNNDMIISDDIESHEDFAINSPGQHHWSYINKNQDATFIIQDHEWPNMGQPHAFIVFNPMRVSPALVEPGIEPNSGDKFLGSFAMEIPSNNFIISPELSFRENFTFEFMGRSLTEQYGKERIKVGYSTTDASESSFKWLHTGNYIEVPSGPWTKYSYTVPKNAKYVTINCVSNNTYLFMLDDIFIGIKNNSKSFVEYEVYLDGEFVSKTNDIQYEFKDLKTGKHIAGVKAVYTTGTSAMSTKEFEFLSSVKGLSETNIKIYPNPATEKIFVEGDYKTLQIFDISGKMVLNIENVSSTIDISNLISGSYLVKIDGNTFNIIKK